ncbi:hypothetical protein C2S51_003985 [Perilla frutescens var. frutescens]|nr:hypothetical protein C2S51_003985 [Perilla frutescens var. frutescens]
MSDAEEVIFSLTVMINKEKSKVLFAESDSHFADILLSFLTLPLGRIMKVLKKHYGDDTPTIGSLNSLYHSLANLDSSHFWTEAAKLTLLNPTSSLEDEYQRLKLDICDYQPAEYFHCSNYRYHNKFPSVSMYYDHANICKFCGCKMSKEVFEKGSQAASSDGVFTIHTASFIISDDLQILPNEIGLLGIISILGITDTDKAEPIKVTFGFSEIMNLLKASLISQTPLSDLLLNKTRQMNSLTVESELETSINQIEKEENPNSKKMTLKVMIQKSTGKLLYAQAKEDFIEFLFSFLNIPLGGVEHLLAGKSCIKAINNLYQSTAELIDDEYFKTPDTKNRLIKPNLPHGCVSKKQILPLTEECLPAAYSDLTLFSCVKFPQGQGNYLERPRTYKVMDDLTVTPFCIVSILSRLNELKIPISDVKQLDLQIGLKEAFSWRRAQDEELGFMVNSLPIEQEESSAMGESQRHATNFGSDSNNRLPARHNNGGITDFHIGSARTETNAHRILANDELYLAPSDHPDNIDHSALLSNQRNAYKGDGFKKRLSKEEKARLKCEHCGGKGHLKADCFELVGIPDWYKKFKTEKGKGKSQAMMNTMDESRNDCGGSHKGFKQDHSTEPQTDVGRVIQAELAKHLSLYFGKNHRADTQMGEGHVNAANLGEVDLGESPID